MQTGTVTHISPRKGMFVLQLGDGGDFVVFENLSSTDIAVGDQISGRLDALGGEQLLHVGHGEVFHAYGQSGPSSLKACLLLIG